MTLKQCDRCGAFFVENEFIYNKRLIEGICFKANVFGRHFYYCEKDLCDDCITQLTKWLDAKAKFVDIKASNDSI